MATGVTVKAVDMSFAPGKFSGKKAKKAKIFTVNRFNSLRFIVQAFLSDLLLIAKEAFSSLTS